MEPAEISTTDGGTRAPCTDCVRTAVDLDRYRNIKRDLALSLLEADDILGKWEIIASRMRRIVAEARLS